MAQVCFTIDDAKAAEVRLALLEDRYTPAEIAAMTNAQKAENARLTIVGWIRTAYREYRLRKEGDTDNSVT